MAKGRKTGALIRGHEMPSALTGAAMLLDRTLPVPPSRQERAARETASIRKNWEKVGQYIAQAIRQEQQELRKRTDGA